MKSKPKRKGLVYAIGQFFLTLFYYPVFRLHVRGRENVPRTGPVLLCCNHMAKRDPVMLGVSVRRQVFYMAKEELFENWFIGGPGGLPRAPGHGRRGRPGGRRPASGGKRHGGGVH